MSTICSSVAHTKSNVNFVVLVLHCAEDVAELANPPDGEDGGRKAPQKTLSDEEFANIVDAILTENDSNGDGYVEYFEFKRMQDRQRQQRASEPKSP